MCSWVFTWRTDFTPPVYWKTEDQKERIKACLEKSFLFSSLDEDEMSTVILALKERVVEPDTRIIVQGDDGECMYLIESGSVDCTKELSVTRSQVCQRSVTDETGHRDTQRYMRSTTHTAAH